MTSSTFFCFFII